MAFITADRVLDSSTSTGTGAFVVSGTPAAGYRTFSAVMSVGDTCYYSIQGQTTSEWEVGLGTYSSANTLTRTTVYSSSNSGSAVTFSAGTKNVFITMAAAKSPQLDPSGNVTALGVPVSVTLTNATGLSLTTGVTGVLPANNGGTVAWQSVQTGNFTAVAGRAYPVNTTSGAITVTLPGSPTAGNIVQLTDYAGTWGSKAITVNPNGLNINGSTSNIVLNVSRESVALVYIDATQGWLAYSGFVQNPTNQISYLVVAGGGGGGTWIGGGGGAGGLLSGSITLIPSTVYTVTVGAGGAATSSRNSSGTNGSNSVFSVATAIGGGGGGSLNSVGSDSGSGSGGSGGGAEGLSSTAGSGTSGQGNAGGIGSGGTVVPGGGGGGAGSVGGNSVGTTGGAGGSGLASSITGSSVTYAGGGGGSPSFSAGVLGGAGGSGGGGAGGNSGSNGTNGTANTGGGGGGASNNSSTANTSGTGGSGVVILSVPTALYTGTTTGSPTVTTSGTNTILKYTTSGTYTA